MSSTKPGYLQPITAQNFPRDLTLTQFIQTVLVGISNIDGTLVRPKWQVAPLKNPELAVNWLNFGIGIVSPDANGYEGVDQDGNNIYQRQEGLEISCSFYGPDALDNAALVRDGFQITQNRDALRRAGMGFVETGRMFHLPELINERWFERYEMTVILRRQVNRVYPILTFVSAKGTIYTATGEEQYLLNWQTPTPP